MKNPGNIKSTDQLSFIQRHYILSILSSIGIVALFFTYFVLNREFRCGVSYDFINNSVACDSKPVISKAGYAKTQSELTDYIESQKKNGTISQASLYFRDLNNGPVFGVNETEPFTPASLLKLPLSLVFFGIAEKNPEILQEKIMFIGREIDFNQNFISERALVPNTQYTILELLERMLVDSDNDAYFLLYEYLEVNNKLDLVPQTYLELGILSPKDQYDEVISVRRYASIFRALYHISYVGPEYSEQILKWLGETQFLGGLDNGDRPDMKISHKFGERVSDDRIKQLHDCGIVYYPDNPYLLCVMTKGEDFQKMSLVIRNIADIVFKEVDSRKTK